MKYLSTFSGIEAATIAWESLGFEPIGFSEIDPFACAVLSARFPTTQNYGDITKSATWGIKPGAADILIGGSPCQSYSLSGKRGGLSDPRGQLMLSFVELARDIKPKYIVWENVVGVLSSNEGRDFAAFLEALSECGYAAAWRVFNAKGFGIPQQRRRVFLIACIGSAGWETAASILSIAEGVRWDRQKGSEQREETEPEVPDAAANDGRQWPAKYACTLNASFGDKQGLENQHALGGASLFIPSGDRAEEGLHIRKITPIEAERLMGFPDDWTRVPWKGKPSEACPDAPRYKACGNSIVVPILRHIGQKIKEAEANNIG
jgi:DNA (cytosine-5)-methyltransferase 1